MATLFHEMNDGVTFNVKVIPRANRNEIVGVENDALKIRLNAPPLEGRANEALIKFLAEMLGVARTKVEIVRGETARNKVIRVRGVSLKRLQEDLLK